MEKLSGTLKWLVYRVLDFLNPDSEPIKSAPWPSVHIIQKDGSAYRKFWQNLRVYSVVVTMAAERAMVLRR